VSMKADIIMKNW